MGNNGFIITHYAPDQLGDVRRNPPLWLAVEGWLWNLAWHRVEIIVTGSTSPGPPARRQKKKSVTQMQTKFRYMSRLSLFSSQTQYLKAYKPSVLFRLTRNAFRFYRIACSLNSVVNSLCFDSVEISQHLPVKMNSFCPCSFRWGFHANLYTISSPTRHLNIMMIRRTPTVLFVSFKCSNECSISSASFLHVMFISLAPCVQAKYRSIRERTSALASVRAHASREARAHLITYSVPRSPVQDHRRSLARLVTDV